MKYCYLVGTDLLENYQCFAELDDELVCLRAVYKTEEGIFNTFTNDILTKYHILPEGSWDLSLDGIKLCSKEVFLKLWNESMGIYEEPWNKLKLNHKIGQVLYLPVVCLYPQGVILKINNLFNALANYEYCNKKFGSDKMYPTNIFELKLLGFDDENKLVIVG